MELAIAALRDGSEHLNLVAFDRGGSEGELFSYEVQRDRPAGERQYSVGIRREAAAHEYPVGAEGTVAVSKYVEGSVSIKHICLHGNATTDERSGPRSPGQVGIVAMCKALHRNQSVLSLSIRTIDVTDDTCRVLGDALTHHPTLEHLRLSKNNLSIRSMEPLANALRGHQLSELEISHNTITGAGAELLCSGLVSNANMRSLILDEVGLNRAGAKAVALVLAAHRRLARVSLQCNTIGDRGAEALAEGLAANQAVTHLNLAMNGIGDAGCAALCSKGLAHHPCLRELNLRGNVLGDPSAEALAHVLTACPAKASLTALDLDLNFLGDPGIGCILNVLPATSLRYCELWGNTVLPGDSFPKWTESQQLLQSRQQSDAEDSQVSKLG